LFYEWQSNDFDWGVESESSAEAESTIPGVFYTPEPSVFGITWNFSGVNVVIVRYWLPVVVAAALAAVPWICYRFSLRTLLIATTLVAVMLGIAVYVASRSN
jgi:hypothetical protein